LTSTFRKHDPGAPADFFAVEAEGLDWLRAAGAIAVPEVLSVDAESIELERIDAGPWTPAAEERFGRELAALHRAGAPAFGWHRDGYIGPLPVANTEADDWPAFYWTTRIEPFVRSAALAPDAIATFDRLASRVADLAGPAEPPARLHGDLWRGNVLADQAGRPWIIDPSAHGGHRETDLAMLQLFGGFGSRCIDAYDEVFPLADGWRDRVALHQLYPLLVHAVLFGGGYAAQALAAARRYSG
jgi:fructosamine-3-kinase